MSNEVLKPAAIIFYFWIIIAVSVHTAPIPFSLKRGIPEIEVVINDSVKATFAIDTGADHIYIDKTFAEKNGLLSNGKMPMRPTVGIEGKVEAFQISLRKLEIGEVKQSAVRAVAIDLRDIIKDTSKGLPDGVLGYAFLKNYKTLLDYHDLLVSFNITDSVDTSKYMKSSVSITPDKHLILLNTGINWRTVVRLILDTGSSISILDSIFVEEATISDLTSVLVKVDEVSDRKTEFIIKDISSVANTILGMRTSGILGTTFLRDQTIIIDYEKKVVTFLYRRVTEKMLEDVIKIR